MHRGALHSSLWPRGPHLCVFCCPAQQLSIWGGGHARQCSRGWVMDNCKCDNLLKFEPMRCVVQLYWL